VYQVIGVAVTTGRGGYDMTRFFVWRARRMERPTLVGHEPLGGQWRLVQIEIGADEKSHNYDDRS